MSGRILIIDPIPTNRIVMRVKLASAFYEVLQASSGQAALAGLTKSRPDIIIASGGLGDMEAEAFCAALRSHALGKSIPIVLISSDASPSDRLAALAAGADDVLPRPVDDLVLLARLRSLLRARDAQAELELRDDTRRALGMAERVEGFVSPGRVTLVSSAEALGRLQPLCESLRRTSRHNICLRAADDLLRKGDEKPDVIVLVEPPGKTGNSLVLLPQLRTNGATRNASLIYVARPNQRREAASALDMGANDLVVAGPEPQELVLRIDRQITRKRMDERLRADMRDGLRAAVIDPLTGLYNRRYAAPHLKRLAEGGQKQGRPFALLLADVDHFKRINDAYGHGFGDEVLRELALRLHGALRPQDMLARYGGEEFLIAMPATDQTSAQATAERICKSIAERPVIVKDDRAISVTLSIGVALGRPDDDMMPDALVDLADRALYCAKGQGRNMVVMADRIAPLLSPHRVDRPQTRQQAQRKPARKSAGI